jgi:hypothetical protein
MVGNFCGVLIFVIWFAVTKISTHENKCLPYLQGVWPNSVEAWPTFSVLVNNNRYYHPVDGVFVTNIVLSHASCPRLFEEVVWWQGNRARSRARIDYYHRLRSAAPLDWAADPKFKIRKLILRAFSDFPRKWAPPKITRHTVLCV